MEYSSKFLIKGGAIMQKDFNEFLSTLDENTILNIVNKINEPKIELNFSLTEKGLNNLLTNVTTLDLRLTIEILHLYHNWLNA